MSWCLLNFMLVSDKSDSLIHSSNSLEICICYFPIYSAVHSNDDDIHPLLVYMRNTSFLFPNDEGNLVCFDLGMLSKMEYDKAQRDFQDKFLRNWLPLCAKITMTWHNTTNLCSYLVGYILHTYELLWHGRIVKHLHYHNFMCWRHVHWHLSDTCSCCTEYYIIIHNHFSVDEKNNINNRK